MEKGPTWRTWAISVIVAVILAVTASLLLGGSHCFFGIGSAPGCARGNDCCAPPPGRR